MIVSNSAWALTQLREATANSFYTGDIAIGPGPTHCGPFWLKDILFEGGCDQPRIIIGAREKIQSLYTLINKKVPYDFAVGDIQ